MTASSLPVILAYRRCLCRELEKELERMDRAMFEFALVEVNRRIAEMTKAVRA